MYHNYLQNHNNRLLLFVVVGGVLKSVELCVAIMNMSYGTNFIALSCLVIDTFNSASINYLPLVFREQIIQLQIAGQRKTI